MLENFAALDRIAQFYMQMDKDIRFDIAKTDTELEAIYRLRYRVVIESGWAKPADYPDGMERDEYDDTAIHAGGWQDNTLAATMRMVLPSSERPLPTEAAFGIQIAPAGKVVDCSRGIVAPEFRHRSHQFFFGVLARLWVEMCLHGYENVCGTATEEMVKFYERGGFMLIKLGEVQPYWGEMRYPVIFNIPASVRVLQDRG